MADADAATARWDRGVALTMVPLAAAAAVSFGTPRAVLIAVSWACISAAAAAATLVPGYGGLPWVALVASLRAVWPAVLQLFVASGRRAPVTLTTQPEFWASRTGPWTVFLYAVTARLPPRVHRVTLLLSALACTALLPASCEANLACYRGMGALCATIAARGAAAAAAGAAFIAGVSVASTHIQPCEARSCVLVMAWLFNTALVAAEALARSRSKPAATAARVAVRSALLWAALVAADALTPCAPLPIAVGGVTGPLCAGAVPRDPPIKWLWQGKQGGGSEL